MAGKARAINQDGKTYTFKPGKGGSLTAPASKQVAMDLSVSRKPVAKIVPMKRPTSTGSVRG